MSRTIPNMVGSGKCPCRECHASGQSYVGCHGKCLRYIDWKQANEVEREHINHVKEQERIIYAKAHHYVKSQNSGHKVQSNQRER